MFHELLSEVDKFRTTLLKKISEAENNKNLITQQSQLYFGDFTDSEKEVLDLLAHGFNCTEIAKNVALQYGRLKLKYITFRKIRHS